MAEQTSFSIPGLTVTAPLLTVNRGVTGSPQLTEVITSLVLTQQIQINDTTANPATRGYSTFTWTWTAPASTVTNDIDTAMAAAGWDTALPCLDPTQTYNLAITQAAPAAS